VWILEPGQELSRVLNMQRPVRNVPTFQDSVLCVGTERGPSLSRREIQLHWLCICQTVLNSMKTQIHLYCCRKPTYPVHRIYPKLFIHTNSTVY